MKEFKMTEKKEDFIWIQEAAEMIGIHPVTLSDWIEKHDRLKSKNPDELTKSEKKFRCPPYGRLGSRYRFRKEDVEQFIKESMGE